MKRIIEGLQNLSVFVGRMEHDVIVEWKRVFVEKRVSRVSDVEDGQLFDCVQSGFKQLLLCRVTVAEISGEIFENLTDQLSKNI